MNNVIRRELLREKVQAALQAANAVSSPGFMAEPENIIRAVNAVLPVLSVWLKRPGIALITLDGSSFNAGIYLDTFEVKAPFGEDASIGVDKSVSRHVYAKDILAT